MGGTQVGHPLPRPSEAGHPAELVAQCQTELAEATFPQLRTTPSAWQEVTDHQYGDHARRWTALYYSKTGYG